MIYLSKQRFSKEMLWNNILLTWVENAIDIGLPCNRVTDVTSWRVSIIHTWMIPSIYKSMKVRIKKKRQSIIIFYIQQDFFTVKVKGYLKLLNQFSSSFKLDICKYRLSMVMFRTFTMMLILIFYCSDKYWKFTNVL